MQIGQVFSILWDKLRGWGEGLIGMIPNLVAAAAILVATWYAARLAAGALRRAIHRVSANDEVTSLLARSVQLLLVAAGLFAALGILQLEKTVASLLAGVGILGLALGFACQDIAANFVSGILMSVRHPFRVGDVVETNGFLGVVERMELRALRLRKTTGELVVLPNRLVYEKPIVNFSDEGRRRVDVEVGISYGEDLARVRRVVLEVVSRLERRLVEPEPEFYWVRFGESSIDLVVRFWARYRREKDHLAARSEAIQAIQKAFAEQEIPIPFPVRTLDFSEVGGTTIGDAMDDDRISRRVRARQ